MSEQTTYTEHIYEDSDMEHEYYHIIPFGSMREEIVRCRDCEHYKPWVLSRPENGGDCHLNKNEVDVTHDGFCSWGERRNDG